MEGQILKFERPVKRSAKEEEMLLKIALIKDRLLKVNALLVNGEGGKAHEAIKGLLEELRAF